jgi:hypothetical protein
MLPPGVTFCLSKCIIQLKAPRGARLKAFVNRMIEDLSVDVNL